MNTDNMTYLPETLSAIARLGLAFDELDLAPPDPVNSKTAPAGAIPDAPHQP